MSRFNKKRADYEDLLRYYGKDGDLIESLNYPWGPRYSNMRCDQTTEAWLRGKDITKRGYSKGSSREMPLKGGV